MARFSGSYSETFSIDAPIDVVAAHFGNLDQIVANYGPLQKHQKIDANTLYLLLEPKSEKGVTFRGEYTCRYTYPDPHTLEWKTIDNKTLFSNGRARFVSEGPNRTRVEYSQTMEAVMEANFLLAKLIPPIVSREIAAGVKAYLDRMRRACPRA